MFEDVPENSRRLLLVDGSSYLFRAYYALPTLTNQYGEHTGAILGIINMLKRIPTQLKTNHVVIVFDAKGKNFRHQLFPEYKANRKAMPEELGEQIEPIHQIVHAMGFPLLCVPEVEADDVIGTLAREAAQNDWEVIISTGDKDMAQLVTPRISLMDTMKNTVTDVASVRSRYGIEPEQMVDYLALVGDTSDNIPGVPKAGPKTVAKWLKHYHSVSNLIARADEIGGKIGENLRNFLPRLQRSYDLATIRINIDLDFTLEQCLMRRPDYARLRELFQYYELHSLLNEVDYNHKVENNQRLANARSNQYDTVLDSETLNTWVTALQHMEWFAIDTETTSLDAMAAELVGISVSGQSHQAAYIPVGHDYEGCPRQLSRQTVLATLKPLLEDRHIAKIGHNLKYDLKVLANAGIAVQGPLFDTMLESYIHNSAANRHDMNTLAAQYLHLEPLGYEAVAGKGKNQLNFSQVPLDKAAPYAAEDADITFRLHQHFWPQISQSQTLADVFLQVEMPLMRVLTRMERHGVRIDTDKLNAQSRELNEHMQAIENQVHTLAGESFNLASTQQLAAILFTKLGLPVIRKTPGGQPSTSVEVLQELACDYELPRLILDHRHYSKLKSTYTDKLPHMINPDTGRVHTSYQQAVAITGRLSSTDPNLQNIPIRTEQGRRIRQAFVAREGCRILAADYSQVELRIMAHLSADQSLIDAFRADKDIHAATAAELAGIPLHQVTSEQRRRAKAVNFGLIYGMSAFGLARQLNISRGEAQDYVDTYFERYPGVKDYMERARHKAGEQGYVETLIGRRLYLPEINSRNAARRRAAERAAINAPMQGSAADIIKKAMIEIDQWIEQQALPITMLMQVHDELIFEVEHDYAARAQELIREKMSQAAELTIPLVVETGIGENWDQAH